MAVLHPVRVIMRPVRLMVHHCEMCLRPGIMPVPRTIYIVAVVPVNISGIMCKVIVMIIVEVQMPHSCQSPKMVIRDVHVARLDDPSVVIIIYRHVLNLDHCSKIVVLNKGIVVIT